VDFKIPRLVISFVLVTICVALGSLDLANLARVNAGGIQPFERMHPWLVAASFAIAIASITWAFGANVNPLKAAIGYGLAVGVGSLFGSILSPHPEETSLFGILGLQWLGHLLSSATIAAVAYLLWKGTTKLRSWQNL
jgi:hypothetical protein